MKRNLAQLSEQGEPLPIFMVMHIFKQVAGALDYAHKQDILHGDIKPDNILFDQSGRVCLTDFGFIGILRDVKITKAGMSFGTPAIISSEQCRGLKPTKASDIYALGILFFELLTGQVPFKAQAAFGVVQKQINDPVPSLREFRPDLPEALEQIV